MRGTLVRGTPKTHERRSVPFPAFLEPPLRARAAGKQPQEPLFVSSRGLEMRNGNFRKRVFLPALKRLQERDARFPTVTVHDLRHTAASLAISAGANVKAVQRMLGHASAAMTLDVYADLFDDDLDHVAGRLDDAAQQGVAKMWSSPSPG
ncbi:tyrosine-type recombinase/integrase [Microbacterium sp. CGR1]|uniref:tyrosine-type recombinase/integrase n=1 Tax=Microbacterium sp. CGR1 TaxID=1696072 RepID=UPI003DA3DF1E